MKTSTEPGDRDFNVIALFQQARAQAQFPLKMKGFSETILAIKATQSLESLAGSRSS